MAEVPKQVEEGPEGKQERRERFLRILREALGKQENHEDARPVSITQLKKDGQPITQDGCFVVSIDDKDPEEIYVALDVDGDYVEILFDDKKITEVKFSEEKEN